MSTRTTLATRLPAISAAERATRQREVDFARGNVRHEGGILSDEIERLNARYIAGEINSDTLTAAILQSEIVRS
ncbi:antitoxin VbhA family protein [Sphingomonas sp. CFBP9021]|uniref:antitoxin VbhA family protein n=1 Tax=Sphingomonas sp. CFBP9021 TaxID=3096534 RepID=UPI002A6B62F8|nr:antitoxin VbhA family protein [Sphingomonas sp. CFBP9021]MDY0969070.1 antitoxin VbhA family protein [Sphingomonas sp. CFBP9021]